MPGHTAKLMLRFIDRIRVAAAHDTECEPDQNPLQRAYEVCVSKLSDEERGELVRIVNKLSQQLDEQELRKYPPTALSAASGRSTAPDAEPQPDRHGDSKVFVFLGDQPHC